MLRYLIGTPNLTLLNSGSSRWPVGITGDQKLFKSPLGVNSVWQISLKKILFYLFIFRERGREEEREGEEHQCVVASCMPPTGDLICNPHMCPDWESNWQPFGSQAGTQSTGPNQPELRQISWFSLLNSSIFRYLVQPKAQEIPVLLSLPYLWPQQDLLFPKYAYIPQPLLMISTATII